MSLYLHNTRLRIEKFIYKKGTNVALYNAEHSKRYQNFEEQVQIALFAQIKYIADYKDTLPLLMNLAKSQNDPLFNQVAALIAKKQLDEDIELAAYLIWAGTQGGQAAMDKLGIDGIFALKDERLIEYFVEYSNLTLDSVDEYTKKWVSDKIREGREEGLTPFEMQQKLVEDGEAISKIRAERIVLTETAKAMGVIEQEAALRMGISQVIWRTSIDERVCPICLPLEGDKKTIGDTLFKDGYDAPPAHVSCRCYLEEVIPDNWTAPSKVWLGE